MVYSKIGTLENNLCTHVISIQIRKYVEVENEDVKKDLKPRRLKDHVVTYLPPSKKFPTIKSSAPRFSSPTATMFTLLASMVGRRKLNLMAPSLHICHPNLRMK